MKRLMQVDWLTRLMFWLAITLGVWALIVAGFVALADAACTSTNTYGAALCALTPFEYFPLTDTNSTAVDNSGNANTGTYSGTYTQSITGPFTTGEKCTTFTGINSQVSAPVMTGNASRTIVATLKIANASTKGEMIGVGDSKTVGNGYQLGVGDSVTSTDWATNGTEMIRLYSGVAYKSYGQHPSFVPGMYAQVIMVIDASGHDTIYYDGSPYTPTTNNTMITPLTGNFIGGEGAGATFTACDVAFYQSAISASNVTTLWNAFKALWKPAATGANPYQVAVLADMPAVYWAMNAPSGTSETDITGYGGTGTYVNTPTLNQAGPTAGHPSVLFASASKQRMTFPVVQAPAQISGTEECWVETGGSGSAGAIMEVGLNSALNATSMGIDGGTGNFTGNTLGFTLASRVAGSNNSLLGTLSSSAFKLVDVTVDGAGNLVGYLNASVVQTVSGQTASGRPVTSANLAWWTDNGSGNSGVGHDSFMDGNLADCARYPYPLTQTQIATHLNALNGNPGAWMMP